MPNRTTRFFSREAARSLREFYSSPVSLLGSSRLTPVRVTFSSFFAILVCFVSVVVFYKQGFRCDMASGPLQLTVSGQL